MMLISRAVVIFSWVRLLSFAFVYKGGSRITINRNLRFHTGSDHKYTTRWPKETKVMLREANESSFRIDAVQPSYITPLIVSAIVLTAVGFSQYADVGAVLGATVLKIQNLGPYGYVYFSVAYVLAEILAVPALPLAASSGYLFGLLPGTLIVLFSATLAASISFYIGRTFLRGWAQNYIAGNPKWKAIDKAIGKEGFRVVLLLRLSPLLPFALSNYLYAITSVDFLSFIAATVLGFAPGTFGLVYFGSAGKELLADGGVTAAHIPWYGYAGAGMLFVLAAQTISKVATGALKSIEEESAE